MGSSRFLSTLRSRLAAEAGFTLIESLMAAVLLMVVGTSLSGVLASSVATYSSSRERTLAEQLTQDQIEAIRRMPFSSVGVPNGNPSGTLAPTRDISVIGLHATMSVQVTYVDDQTPNSFRTYANYKKIVVTVKRAKDQRQLTKEVTFLSAAARNAATESSITAVVGDVGAGMAAVAGATVNLGTGPSAPRTDVTDAGGKVIFPSLTANPTGGGQAYYDLTVTPPYGYVMLRDDLSPSLVAHKQLGVAEPWPTTLRAYKPCFVNVSVPSPPVNPTGGASVPYTLSVGSSRGSEAFAKAAGTTFTGPISSVAGEAPVPPPVAASYTAGASAVVGSGSTAKYWFATAVSSAVPDDYLHNNLGHSFSITTPGNGQWYGNTQVSQLTVKVLSSTGSLVGGARVAISGGPLVAPGLYVAGTTGTTGSATGLLTLMVPSNSSGYTLTAWGPTSSGALSNQGITTTVTKTITLP